jgi:hypothetical protein
VCRHVLKRNLSFARLVILRTVSSAVLESETVYSSLKALSKKAAILSFDSSATDQVATVSVRSAAQRAAVCIAITHSGRPSSSRRPRPARRATTG